MCNYIGIQIDQKNIYIVFVSLNVINKNNKIPSLISYPN